MNVAPGPIPLARQQAPWTAPALAGFFRPSPVHYAYFDGELSGFEFTGKRVLEIGFGDGAFLAWAQQKRCELFGTELRHDAVAAAEAMRITVLDPAVFHEPGLLRESFDLVVAFDVLEHLPMDQVAAYLSGAAQLLRRGGRLVARFPNGQSPLGRVWQHGTVAHLTILSVPIIVELIADMPLTLVRGGAAHRPVYGGTFRRAGMRVRAVMQRALEAALARLYGLDCALSPNVVVVLKRR